MAPLSGHLAAQARFKEITYMEKEPRTQFEAAVQKTANNEATLQANEAARANRAEETEKSTGRARKLAMRAGAVVLSAVAIGGAGEYIASQSDSASQQGVAVERTNAPNIQQNIEDAQSAERARLVAEGQTPAVMNTGMDQQDHLQFVPNHEQ
jgi:phage-related tail fiber protein